MRSFAFLILMCVGIIGAQQCSVSYDANQQVPLLYGGVHTGCQSGCQNRTDEWGQTCGFSSGSMWGVCTQQQTSKVIDMAKLLGDAAVGLSPCELIQYLEGRTLWLIGDSHTKNLYRALQCFMIDFWDHQECESNTDAQAVQDLANLPWQTGGSKCFHLLGDLGGRVCIVNAVLANQLADNQQVSHGGVLPLLRDQFAKLEDIYYISVGAWHEKSTEWWSMFKQGLHSVGKYYKDNQGSWPHLLFREVPAHHNIDPTRQYCKPAQGLTYDVPTGDLDVTDSTGDDKLQKWSLGVTTNGVIADVLVQYEVFIVPTFNITVPLYDAHAGEAYDNSGVDCLHYCQPGVPELWIYYMHRAFNLGRAGIAPSRGSVSGQDFTCVPSTTFQ